MTTTVSKALSATRAAMGKGNAQSQRADEDEDFAQSPGSCTAYGCPCRGTVDLGSSGRFNCSWHAWAPQDRWQAITQGLREHQWLLDFIGELQHAFYRGKNGDWLARAQQFFETDPYCQPTGSERLSFNRYVWRMREELSWRIGIRKERPEPREPMGDSASQGKATARAPAFSPAELEEAFDAA